jgi:hypothetical protein
LAAVAIIGVGAASLPSAAAAAATHHCGPVGIRGVSYSQIVATGVSCGYVENVFLNTTATPAHEVSAVESTTGWTYQGEQALSRKSQRDTWTKGDDEIVYVWRHTPPPAGAV